MARFDHGSGHASLKRGVAVIEPQPAHLHFGAVTSVAVAFEYRGDLRDVVDFMLSRLRRYRLRSRGKTHGYYGEKAPSHAASNDVATDISNQGGFRR